MENDQIRIVRSGDYEVMALTYQCLEIDRLNKTLIENGITDEGLREAICTSYFFSNGCFLDSGWFRTGNGEKTVWPELGFAERPLDPKIGPWENGLTKIETLHLGENFAFHEGVHGDIDLYFNEQGEGGSDIVSGCL